jgi:hypothetical protein
MTGEENTAPGSQRSVPTSIDGNAPVIAHHEIDISAPLSRAWGLHLDVNAWPTWQSDISAAELHGNSRLASPALILGLARHPQLGPASCASATAC